MQKEVYEFISKQTNLAKDGAGDPIVERKTCRVSGNEFPIFQSDLDFYTKVWPTFDEKKYAIPTPTLCPEERQRRRSLFRNERNLYRRRCDFSGDNIISIYSLEKPYTVYHQKIWRSDQWDPLQYGKEIDFSQTFTQQFHTLTTAVPRANFYGTKNENSDYTNHTSYSKNCYLCADMIRGENCLYSTTGIDSSYIVDCELVTWGQYCYRCIDCDTIFSCFFCQESIPLSWKKLSLTKRVMSIVSWKWNTTFWWSMDYLYRENTGWREWEKISGSINI